jgi:3-hydroxy-9,10-secoandrosta-1,3,5(10)-triene-9,17-dione monooxygenase
MSTPNILKAVTMSTPTSEEIIAASAAMIPQLKKRAAEDEINGMVSKEAIKEMIDAGLFRVAQPARWKGYEMPLTTLSQVIINLARADHAYGWVYGLCSLHNHHLAMFDDRAQRDVWGDNPDAITGSSYSPYGKAVSAPGGYTISGTWPFSSGCDHADWYIVGGLVDGDPKNFRSFLVSREFVEIVDDWQVFGMKGTGSKSISIKEAFVPDYRSVPFGPEAETYDYPGYKVNTNPRFKTPFILVFNRGGTAVSIGSLMALIDEFVAYNAPKVSMITGKAIADLPDTLEALGEAVALVDQLKLLAMHDLDALEQVAAEGKTLDPVTMNVYRYRAQSTGNLCLKAAQSLYELVGGGGLYERLPIPRIYRNLIASRNHPATAVFRTTVRQIGSDRFGQESERNSRF